MLTRRDFLIQTAAAGVVATSSVPLVQAEETARESSGPRRSRRVRDAAVARIRSVGRREDTVLRHGGNGDNWHMSWAADDRQYVSLCDGSGFSEQFTAYYNSRMFSMEGGPRKVKFLDLPGYPMLGYPQQRRADPRYYNFGTLALDGRLYQYMSTFNHTVTPGGGTEKDSLRFVGTKLIYSPDNGRTWCNQDGSTPVVWEDWNSRSRETMIFFEEPQETFSLPAVLQMGKNYEHNRDGYVYVYSPNGNTEGTMNELVMFRVRKAQILNRRAYEYFAGLQSNEATWRKDIDARIPVHTFPRGWVNTLWHPYAWQPSVVYNAPLGVYLMTSWGMGKGTDIDAFSGANMDDLWFAKPSYLGFWASSNPWGPWIQIHEETAWLPADDKNARAYQPQIAPKWIEADGKSFWLVWTDFQIRGDKEEFRRRYQAYRAKGDNASVADRVAWDRAMREFMPYYAFNVQRADLTVT